MKPKKYLGDGVYVQNDGFGLILTTEDGIGTTNTIYLEPIVYNSLIEYVAICSEETLKQMDQPNER